MEERTIKTHKGDVVVHELVLREVQQVFTLLKTIPQRLAEFLPSSIEKGQKIQLDSKLLITALPTIVSEALPELSSILVVAIDRDQEFLQGLTSKEVVAIAIAAFEVNDFSEIFSDLKKVTARKAAK